MNRFEFARATSVAEALDLAAEKPGSVFKAGGIDLLDHLKEHLIEPPRLVDLKTIPELRGIVVQPDGSLAIGPLETLAQLAAHPEVRRTHAALARACGEAASPQIRNVATIGGNLLQRPRCWYYRLASYRCLKKGGDTCFAVGGENRYHTIFAEGACNAPHPSNAAMGLTALGASLVLQSPRGTRTVPADRFFTIPDNDPRRENAREPDEILTAISVPTAPGVRSTYASVKEKAAFDWPLVSTAVALRPPWRGLDDAAIEAVANAAVASAQPLVDMCSPGGTASRRGTGWPVQCMDCIVCILGVEYILRLRTGGDE